MRNSRLLDEQIRQSSRSRRLGDGDGGGVPPSWVPRREPP